MQEEEDLSICLYMLDASLTRGRFTLLTIGDLFISLALFSRFYSPALALPVNNDSHDAIRNFTTSSIFSHFSIGFFSLSFFNRR